MCAHCKKCREVQNRFEVDVRVPRIPTIAQLRAQTKAVSQREASSGTELPSFADPNYAEYGAGQWLDKRPARRERSVYSKSA